MSLRLGRVTAATGRGSCRWTMQNFADIANHVSGGRYNAPGVEGFLSKADPWLIAKAMSIGATVVTHEVYDEFVKRKVPIPNVCREFGVPYINTFEALRQLSASFRLHVP